MSNYVDIVIDNEQSLFQYMSFEKCLSLIRNKALPLRNYLSYNDSFECLPEFVEYKAIQALFTASTEDERRRVIHSYLHQLAAKYDLSNEFISGIVDGISEIGVLKFKTIPLCSAYIVVAGITTIYKYAKDECRDNIKRLMELFHSKYFPLMNKYYTSCFTKGMDNILMWSHYADSHHGVVVEFTPISKPFTDAVLMPMKYERISRFNFGLNNLDDDLSIQDNVYSLLSTKSEVWSYENEVRMIYDTDKFAQEIKWYDRHNNPIIKVDIDAINKIYVGRRASNIDILTLQNALEKNLLGNKIEIVRVRLSHRGFRIEPDRN